MSLFQWLEFLSPRLASTPRTPKIISGHLWPTTNRATHLRAKPTHCTSHDFVSFRSVRPLKRTSENARQTFEIDQFAEPVASFRPPKATINRRRMLWPLAFRLPMALETKSSVLKATFHQPVLKTSRIHTNQPFCTFFDK